MNKHGFTLIEFIAYIGLFSFIAVIFIGLASKSQLSFVSSSSNQEILLRQSIALDLLRRDLMSASFLASDWDIGCDVQDDTQGRVFKKNVLSDKNVAQELCVCWTIGVQGLLRVEGDYNFETHEWAKRSSCLICKTIKRISIEPLYMKIRASGRGILSGVWVTYQTSGAQERRFFIKLRNRILHEN
jgi:hypothetical protein